MKQDDPAKNTAGLWSILLSLALHSLIVALCFFLSNFLAPPKVESLTELELISFTDDQAPSSMEGDEGSEDEAGSLTETGEVVDDDRREVQTTESDLQEFTEAFESEQIQESAEAVQSSDQDMESRDQRELAESMASTKKRQAELFRAMEEKREAEEEAKRRAKRRRELDLFRRAEAARKTSGNGSSPGQGKGQRGAKKVSENEASSDGSRTFSTIKDGQVIFVIDISSSMARERRRVNGKRMSGLEYVKSELVGLIRQQLNAKIQFNVIAFGTHARSWRRAVVPAGPELRLEAIEWISKLKVEGGTNLYSALKLALSDVEVSRIILLSDGRPSVGLTKPNRILEEVKKRNKRKVRIDTIRFQSTWSGALLKDLSEQNGGQFKSVSN